MIQYQMKCEHVQHTSSWPQCNMKCDRCKHVFPVVAVETREWHVKCNQCRYGRWFGASESDANLAAAVHQNVRFHTVRVEYMRHPVSYERLRSVMKRSVRWYIEVKPHTMPGARRYSESGAMPMFPSPDYETPPY